MLIGVLLKTWVVLRCHERAATLTVNMYIIIDNRSQLDLPSTATIDSGLTAPLWLPHAGTIRT